MGTQLFDKRRNKGLRHLLNAVRFSLQGLRDCYRNEAAFRQELLVFALILPVGGWCAASLLEFVLLACACLLALALELLNSGIESAIDRFGGERHELSRLAKDYGSAAVMMSLLIVALIFAYILYGYWESLPPEGEYSAARAPAR